MRDTRQVPVLRPKLIAVSVAACFALSSSYVAANPTGPTVISGSAGFAASGNALTVTNSANAIIQWQGFSIGINEITRFVQPSAASAVLNRVVGSGGVVPRSLIDGVLSSNGHVYLLNPMGILIGSSARIDVAGLVASSLNLSDQDFLNGRMRFSEVPGAGGVSNHGVIETPAGGRIFLIAPSVENSGVIRSPQGEIVLAAGKNVELVSEGSPFVTVRLAATTEQAVNVGSLISDSGRIGMYGALVRNSGVAEAGGAVTGAGGQIRFVATRDLRIEAGSRVSANGTAGGKVLLQAEGGSNTIAGTVEATGSAGRGGEVQALGVRVGLIGNGVIDASGETGGGKVLVGGDFQGGNPDVQNSQSTLIGRDGVIRADARTTGDGGRVIVWSDGDTVFQGKISARGGSQSGDGGFVETSGKQSLAVSGRVNVGAPHGKGGTWLLDPPDQTIDQATADSLNDVMSYGGSAVVSADDIHFAAHLDANAGSSFYGGGSFTANAQQNINLNTFTITTNDGQVTLAANLAGNGGSITSTAPFASTQIATNGGSVSLSGTAVTVAGINTTSTSNSPGAISITSTTGKIETGSLTTRGLVFGNSGGSISLTSGSGSIDVNGSIDARGADGSVYYGGGNRGGGGGSVNIIRNSGVAPTILVTGDILTGGGAGSAGYAGGSGGGGGSVNIHDNGSDGRVEVGGTINASGGPGGAGMAAYGGSGGGGGSINIGGPTVTLASVITVGGAGGAGGSSTYTSGIPEDTSYTLDVSGGRGGGGGDVNISSTGAVTINGTIDKSSGAGGAGGAGLIVIDAPGANVNAYVYADGGGGGGHSGSVTIYGGSVTTQSIYVRGGDGGKGGTATISVNQGASVNAQARADGGYSDGGHNVDITANAGPLTINGVLDESTGRGGDGGTANIVVNSSSNVTANAYASGGSTSHVHEISLSATGTLAVNNQITFVAGRGGNAGSAIISINTSGGNVQANARADGGYGSHNHGIYLYGGSISTRGIDGRSGDGGQGGTASVTVGGSPVNVSAYAYSRGGWGGSSDYSEGANLNSAGSIGASGAPIGLIDMQGGKGGHGSPASATVTVTGATGTVNASSIADGGEGGQGGYVSMYSASGASIHASDILTRGGPGGNGGAATTTINGAPGQAYSYAGLGGDGGGIQLNAYAGPISTGNLISHGGDGGSGGTDAGDGGRGGGIYVSAYGGPVTTGNLISRGGNAGPGAIGGDGGDGGSVFVSSPNDITIGAPAITDVFGTVVIDTSGGNAGSGGFGGNAGHITIDPTAILLNGQIVALGGSPGGHGGDITLHTGTEAAPGLITFTNPFSPALLGLNKGYLLAGAAPDGLPGEAFIRGTIVYVFLTSEAVSPDPDVIRSCKP